MGKYSGILICSDFDETIAIRREVSKENREAIKYFCDNGGAFTVISGRQFKFMKEYAGDIGINAPFAGLNGSFIWNFETGEPIHGVELDRRCISPCLEYMKRDERMTNFVLFSENSPIRVTRSGSGFLVSSYNHKEELTGRTFCDDVSISEDGYRSNVPALEEFLSGKIYKFVVGVNSKENSEDYIVPKKAELLSLFDGKIAASRAWPYSIEMQSSDATKGTAVKFIKKYIGADVSIGIGNYENDISMIEDADVGVAVGNSCPGLLRVADRIVKPCEEHSMRDLVENIEEILEGRFDF